MKKFISGILVGVIMATSTVVFAETKQTIEAIFGRVKLVVDGKAVDKETLLYDGTTYVPLRAAAETLGKEVNYDEATNTAYLGKASTDVAPAIEVSKYSFSNPAPIGSKQTVVVDNYTDNYTVDAIVTELIRGEEAWSKVKLANAFNKAPKDGYEYILAKIEVKNVKSSEGKKITISNYNFKVYTGIGKEYTDLNIVVNPEPELNASLYEGASDSGWACFEVSKTDQTPKISYGTEYDGTGGIWFKLYK